MWVFHRRVRELSGAAARFSFAAGRRGPGPRGAVGVGITLLLALVATGVSVQTADAQSGGSYVVTPEYVNSTTARFTWTSRSGTSNGDDWVYNLVSGACPDLVGVGWSGFTAAGRTVVNNRITPPRGPATYTNLELNARYCFAVRWQQHVNFGSDTYSVLLWATYAHTAPPPPTPTISIKGGDPVVEGGNATFALTSSPAPTAALGVDVTVTATGSFGVVAGSRSVSIPTSGTAFLSVPTMNDELDEPNGSVTVRITDRDRYHVSQTAGSATVTVRDDDAAEDPTPTPTPTPTPIPSSPYTAYPPQGICTPSQTHWECDLVALPDTRLRPPGQVPGWRVSWYADADDSDAQGTVSIFSFGTQIYHTPRFGCAATAIPGLSNNICTATSSESILVAQRIVFEAVVRYSTGVAVSPASFVWYNLPDAEEGFETMFLDQPPAVVRAVIAFASDGSRRLALTIDPPPGVQQTQIMIEDRTFSLQTDVTDPNAPTLFSVQVPVSMTREVTFRVRGRSWGGRPGLVVTDDDDDRVIGRVPSYTFGYTPWSQPYTILIRDEPLRPEVFITPMPASAPVGGAITEIGEAFGRDADDALMPPLVFLVVSLAAGMVVGYFCQRGVGQGGLISGASVAVLVWAILGPALGGVDVLLAWPPLVVPAALGVMVVIRMFR